MAMIRHLLFYLSIIGLVGCGHAPPAAPPPAKTLPNVVAFPQAVELLTVGTCPNTTPPIATTGTLKADAERRFQVGALLEGRVAQAPVPQGQSVNAGQVLAWVESPEIARIQANYIHELHTNEVRIQQAQARLNLAQKALARENALLAQGITPRRDVEQAQADLTLAETELHGAQEHQTHLKSEARALLAVYGVGLPDEKTHALSRYSPVRSPRAGVVVAKHVAVGDGVTPQTVLFELADLSNVWLEVPVYPADQGRLREGLTVRFTPDGMNGATYSGTLRFVADQTETGTLTARAVLPNPQGRLRPGMMGRVLIDFPAVGVVPCVPEAAVQGFGKQQFVFTPLGKGRFERVNVQLGASTPGGVLVNNGLRAGQTVVGTGSFLLKSLLLAPADEGH
jgi:cobalt-zinc-cadmium efflux system membrane fusion protein